MNEASRYLQRLARRVAAAYVAHAKPRAILLTGSAAAGESDSYSDVDLIAYYDARPNDAQRAAAREHVASDFGNLPLGDPTRLWRRPVHNQRGAVRRWARRDRELGA